MKHYMELEAGLLVRSQIREYLDSARFLGYEIEYIEHKHWLASDFEIKGDSRVIAHLAKQVVKFNSEDKQP